MHIENIHITYVYNMYSFVMYLVYIHRYMYKIKHIQLLYFFRWPLKPTWELYKCTRTYTLRTCVCNSYWIQMWKATRGNTHAKFSLICYGYMHSSLARLRVLWPNRMRSLFLHGDVFLCAFFYTYMLKERTYLCVALMVVCGGKL